MSELTPDKLNNADEASLLKRPQRLNITRCFLALLCSHVAAPYAAARFTIRYGIGGGIEIPQAIVAFVAISVAAALSYRQLQYQPIGRRLLYCGTLLLLWFLVSLCLLEIASDSAIPLPQLTILWSLGTVWVLWLAWGLSFVSGRGFLIGVVSVTAAAMNFWSIVDITGLTGDAKVEFAWRKSDSAAPVANITANKDIPSLGRIVWSQYLGNERNGSVADTELNADWSRQPPQERWRSSCGSGWSSFATTESVAFSQEQIDNRDCVVARDLKNGHRLWTTAAEINEFRSTMGGDGPRATPTLHKISDINDSQQIVVLAAGPTGQLSCLRGDNGHVVWQVDLAELFPGENLVHGVCASPLVVAETVIACPASPDGPCLAAFSLTTGDVVWTCDSDWRSSYASPQHMNLAGADQVVLHASPGVIAVSPEDGRVLWQHEFTNEWDNNATQPLTLPGQPNDLVIATGYRGGVARLSIHSSDSGDMTVEEVWTNNSTMKTKFCNMALFDHVIVGLDNGILCGVDIASGKRLWKEGRFGHGQILQIGRHLVVIEERGRLHLLKPDAEGHHPIGKIEALDRKTWNHPVLAGNQLLLRNDQEIVCFRVE